MLSFRRFIIENHEYHSPEKILTKSQLSSLRKHPSYKTYVDHPIHNVYVRKGDRHSPAVHNYVMANSSQKHKMDVAITPKGKILNHTVYTKKDGDDNTWHIIKNNDNG